MTDKLVYFRIAAGDHLPVRLVDNGDDTYSLAAAPDPVDSATVTSVNSSSSSQQLLAANDSRHGVMAVNTDANACLLKYGSTASSTSFTVRIPANSYWEMPQPIYRGRIDVIWEGDGEGALVVTEI